MNEAIRTLLKDEPRALKALHDALRFDYNKPFQAVLIEGNTTIKRLRKAVSADDNSVVVVLSHLGKWINPDRWNVALLTSDTTFDITINGCWLSTYYRKSDFKEGLKDFSKAIHVVICQQKEYLTPTKKNHKGQSDIKDHTTRYLLEQSSVRYDSFRLKREGVNYIESFRVFDIESKGENILYYSYESATDITNIIDKSGYFVAIKRSLLKDRAIKARANKAKAAFEVFDTSDKVDELKLRIEAKRFDLVALLRNAMTYEQLKEVDEKLGSWDGLTKIVKEFEEMKQGVADKSYSSIESFNNHYNRISNMLLRI